MRTSSAALLAVISLTAGASPAAAPPVVPWEQAGTRVGQVITVEGEVRSARTVGDTCVLEFAPGDPAAFRAVLLLPVFAGGPSQPERLYAGRRVRVTGRVQRFRGRPEIVLRGPEQIELDPVAAAAPAASAIGETPPAPPTPAEQVRRTRVDASPCERARARWRDAAADANTRAAALGRCLDALRYRCGAEVAALGPALTTLDSIERQVEAACR